MIKLSIIITVYNCNELTDKLLKALDKQIADRDDIQVIVVDDGSEEKYTADYKWCEVYNKKNGGVSSARNYGLSKVKGEYVSFIDGDDMVAGTYVKNIINKIDKEHFDYCYLSWKAVGGWDVVVKLNTVNDEFPDYNLCVWNRVYKFEPIKDLKFNEKKQIAEDAEFIKEAAELLKDGKKSFISTIMYHYKSNTPNSLTKRFNNGELETKRTVYHFNHITKDMTYLIDEIKKINKSAEVIILTQQNDIPELKKYALIMNPNNMRAGSLKGTDFKGEPTNIFVRLKPPIKTQIVIYTSETFRIGGIETFVYNFCMNMKDKYNIAVVYDTMHYEQINRIKDYVKVIKNDTSRIIECDTAIVNRITDTLPSNIKYKQSIQMVHCCKMFQEWHVPKGVDYTIEVSNASKDSFKNELVNTKNTVISNFSYSSHKPRKVLRLISATRLTAEKGEKRMIALGKLLTENNIPFIWHIFAERSLETMYPGMIRMEPTLDISDYIADADYLVQLSNCEAYCYSLVEALELGTPVLTTPIDVLKDIGVKDGENGFVLPFNMTGIDIDKIYNANLEFEYSVDNDKIFKQWKKILGNTTPDKDYMKDNVGQKRKVKALCRFRDINLDKIIETGTIYEVSEDRAFQLMQRNVVAIL